MLKIAMDTAGDLAEGWEKEFDIKLIPINIIFEGKSYLQGVDLKYEDFYQLVEKKGIIPSTSQPTPHQFLQFYRSIARRGETVLSIHITDKLSGTMASARQAADELKGEINVVPFDSASGTICMGMMCKEARLMERSVSTLEKILERLDYMRQNMQLIFTLDTLKYAQMSGRVKSIQAAFASLLNVKPIIELKQGIIEMGEKVRSRAKSLDKLLEKMEKKVGDQRINAAVVHARDAQTGADLLKKVVTRFNCTEAVLAEISISLAGHFGPGTIGIAAYPIGK